MLELKIELNSGLELMLKELELMILIKIFKEILLKKK